MKIKSVLTKPIFLLFISAIFSALPLTFSNLFILSWLAFIPFFYVVLSSDKAKLRHAIGRGFLFGFIYHALIYYWFLWFYPLEYVNLDNAASIGVVCLAWFGISIVHGALWCVPFILCHLTKKITQNNCFVSLVAIIGILITQKIPQLGELSFPWVRIALGQYKATALIQSASIFGIDGVDTLILVINALITISLIAKSKKRVAAILSAVIIFSANLGFGLVKTNQTHTGDSIKVLTVQASIPTDEKWDTDGDTICYDAYSSLTKENLTDNIDLILWPESAVPKIYSSKKSLNPYKKLSDECNTPIIAGVVLKTDKGNTNNALLIDKDGLKSTYTKRQMVPFGEYMPYQKLLSKIFPSLTKLNIIEDDYVSGKSSAIINVAGGKIGTVICFESTYPKLSRQSTLDGAELLIEVTNDSWLEDSPAMYQHLAHGVFRSIENGRYLIRSANSGISAVIDNHGNVVSQLGANEQGVITDNVQFIENQTLYTKTGDIFLPALIILALILFVIIIIKKIKAL